MQAHSYGLCIRCRAEEAPEPLGLCTACVLHTRIEIGAGLSRLAQYLASWAAFDDWLRARGVEPV
jgi:hypothetical protein